MQQINWWTRPLSIAEQKEILGFSSPNTLKAHEASGLLPPEFPVGPNKKARNGEDIKEILDARAAGATDDQVHAIVERQKVTRQKWFDDLMVEAVA